MSGSFNVIALERLKKIQNELAPADSRYRQQRYQALAAIYRICNEVAASPERWSRFKQHVTQQTDYRFRKGNSPYLEVTNFIYRGLDKAEPKRASKDAAALESLHENNTPPDQALKILQDEGIEKLAAKRAAAKRASRPVPRTANLPRRTRDGSHEMPKSALRITTFDKFGEADPLTSQRLSAETIRKLEEIVEWNYNKPCGELLRKMANAFLPSESWCRAHNPPPARRLNRSPRTSVAEPRKHSQPLILKKKVG